MKPPHYKQKDQNDSGPTCLRIIAKFYGLSISMQKLRSLCHANQSQVTILDISTAAENIGFRTSGSKLTLDQLMEVTLPCILLFGHGNFVVLYKIKKRKFFISDPARGLLEFSESDLIEQWLSGTGTNVQVGGSLLIEPTPVFYQLQENEEKLNWRYFITYFSRYRQLVLQLFASLVVSTILSLITPLLAQSMIDIGVNTRNINFVYLVLIAQIMLFVGSVSVDFIRSWVLLHMSTRVNIFILTDFLIKLMKLPVKFFETKTIGDIMQRVYDQNQLQHFLTGPTLNTFFSIFNLIVFTIVLAFYSSTILVVSVTGTLLYTGWILLFLKSKRSINYRQFDNSSQNQNAIVEIVSGMKDIKINNCEQRKRWNWGNLQAIQFKLHVKNLTLSQYQQAGSMFINQAKNILIIFLSVKEVIEGQMTLGGLVAIQYIVGQASSPIDQLLSFIQSYQDAKISLERISEIHELKDEESVENKFILTFPTNKSIEISNLTFSYLPNGNEPVLDNISFNIPQGKTTAIVGMSGSGKTTILKLLLRFVNPEKGEIKIGNIQLERINFKVWRNKCGTVLQDGYIFTDTVENNISLSDEHPDPEKLQRAIEIANLQDFINELPLGVNTRIGSGGSGISQGQKQRILIARAIYKDPDYIFFDEATSALDANNEFTIMKNLQVFFKNRTVVVVAHRLSTVRNADNIILLNKGRIIEEGDHNTLIAIKGQYYELVKNQLELGSKP